MLKMGKHHTTLPKITIFVDKISHLQGAGTWG